MSLAHYRTLGRSGLKVSPLCLGAMTFGEEYGIGSDAASSTQVLQRYLELGGNFVDTANLYNGGHSERIIGDFIAANPAQRQRLIIATKFSANMHPGDPNTGGASRKAIINACEESLRRLKTDYIDLYWKHWVDAYTPIEETMQALDDLVRCGKVRYIGFSDTPAWRVAQAQMCALARGWAPLIALQIEYSLLQRTVEGELIPMALEFGLGVTPWAPLRSGFLTGKYSRTQAVAESTGRAPWIARNANAVGFRVVDKLKEIAASVGASPARCAIAWLCGKPGVVSPIIGARTLAQLDENVGGLDVHLSAAHVAALDDVSVPTLNFPAEMLKFAVLTSYGGMTINGNQLGPSPFEDRQKK